MQYFCDFESALKFTPYVKQIFNQPNTWWAQVGTNPFLCQTHGLFIPIVANNRVLAYYNCVLVSQAIPVDLNGLVILDPTTLAAAELKGQIKLLPQTVKMLKLLAHGKNLHNGNSRSTRGVAGMKVRLTEAMKAWLLGYINLPQDESLLTAIANSCYDLQAVDGSNTKKPGNVRYSYSDRVDTAFNYLNAAQVSSYQARNVSRHVGFQASRSAKDVQPGVEVKWRKPSKTSIWPYTLDHHWFEIQESAVSIANHVLKSLLNRTESSHHASRQIDLKFPILHRQAVLAGCREVLELFFADTAAAQQAGRYCNLWGSIDYKVRKLDLLHTSPVYLIPKMCLLLGVAPSFDKSGQFLKFNPIDNKLLVNTTKVYLESKSIDMRDNEGATLSNMTLALCYSLGLMSLADLENRIGIINAGVALNQDPNFIKIAIGPNLVCCVSKTFAYDACKPKLSKLTNTPINELTEQDVEEMGLDQDLVDSIKQTATV